MATAKQLDEITECPVCTEVYTDPRVLPCGHTYCLKCLDGFSKDKQPGDELACPLCRKEFALPSNGVSDLPKNFFVANFLQMKELSSVESKTSPCEACGGGKDDEFEVQNAAVVYCVECQAKLCHICERSHKTLKSSRSHKLVKLGEKLDVETLGQSLPPSYCDQHDDETLKIYCLDCKQAICMMCYIKSHNGHKCSDVKEVVDEFRKQMTNDVDNVEVGVQKCREMLQNLEKEKSDFSEQITKAGIGIREKADELKKLIDDHREKLMNELLSMKQKRMKQIESLREEIERQLLSMESYKKYVDQLRQKGTACDIARAASGLHNRADKLLTFDIVERTLADLGHADVTFTSSDFVIDDLSKTLGQLRLEAVKKVKSGSPTLTHVIPSQGRDSVCAVTSLGDDVFVARSSGQQRVEVYDAETLTLRRRLTVPGLRSLPFGLVASTYHHCLYLCDHMNHNVHRVDLSSSNAVMKWSVARYPTGLSVNSERHLVVACLGANILQEYTTHGTIVREICLQTGVKASWHAVQLSTGHYVVSHSTSPGVVSLVGVDGQVVRSCGQSETSQVGQMKYPRSLAVTSEDEILVADGDNNRILSIDNSLSSVEELSLSVDGGIQQPCGLCLDESRGRLYVGEGGGEHRLLVFDGASQVFV